jgi:hypothetical protein
MNNEVIVCEDDCLHKECDLERKRRYREENKEEIAARAKGYRDNRNPEQILKRKIYLEQFNKIRNARPEVRSAHLMKKYGITLKIWETILKIQKNECANTLCRKILQQKPHDTHTDHDHTTGSVRGILCSRCNPLLGGIENLLKFLIEDKIELPPDFDEIQRGLYLYLKDDFNEWNTSWGGNDYRNLHG